MGNHFPRPNRCDRKDLRKVGGTSGAESTRLAALFRSSELTVYMRALRRRANGLSHN
jgi:hypothetical protein